MPTPVFSRQDVIDAEQELLLRRREENFGDDFAHDLDDNRFGIALSGGGIRSATINLGFLRVLNHYNILKQADYLSTVSGGGYTGAYIQSTVAATGDYDELFTKDHVTHMRERGRYLFPGIGWTKLWNIFTLVVSYLVSLIMNMVPLLLVGALAVGGYMLVDWFIDFDFGRISTGIQLVVRYAASGLAGMIGLHYLVNVFFPYRLFVSAYFNRAEAIWAMGAVLGILGAVVWGFEGLEPVSIADNLIYALVGVGIVLLGFFTNPNGTSLHRFYRKQLVDAFLPGDGIDKNPMLYSLARPGGKKGEVAPYPLINTTLNLQSSNDPNFMGRKSSDYFLLSPLFCGSKLTKYVSTEETSSYARITLPAAMTVSAAAVNPGMGNMGSRFLSLAATLLNLRLGYWVWNPKQLAKGGYPLIWWPSYFFRELFSRIGTENNMVNISDGAHIENLGVIELLRRRCRLVVAVDAGADPEFRFEDLENLTVRARNELGIDIRFRKNQIPEEVLRPNPSHGYSIRRFVVADMYQLWDRVTDKDGKETTEYYEDRRLGSFVYIKSSMTAPVRRPEFGPEDEMKQQAYNYRRFHPEFPHESTADQFFDPPQWEAYFRLGQELASDMLGCVPPGDADGRSSHTVWLDELIDRYERGVAITFPPSANPVDAKDPAMTTDESVDVVEVYDSLRRSGKEMEG